PTWCRVASASAASAQVPARASSPSFQSHPGRGGVRCRLSFDPPTWGGGVWCGPFLLPGGLQASGPPAPLAVGAFGYRRSLLLPSTRLRHHRSARLRKLFRVCPHRVGEGAPRTRLSLCDVEFGT